MVFIVYPERSDKAPVVLVTAKNQGPSDWVRAVSDQVATDGFIAVVPDLLTGLGPKGGDADSFSSPESVAQALTRMPQQEIVRRTNAALAYAVALPAANGMSARLDLDTNAARIDAAILPVPAIFHGGDRRAATFKLASESWNQALDFLTAQTANKPIPGTNVLAEEHAGHDHAAMLLAMAQAAPQDDAKKKGGGRGGPRGYPTGKLHDLPAGTFTATSTLKHSTLQKEFVNIPVGEVQVHTWIEYPEGNGKAPVVIVMQHGPGLDDWQRALADQLALEGFIAVAADLYSGLGPNGGNYDSFEGTDAAMRAAARLTQDEGIRRYKAAYDYAMKLPRANGKSASLGFCAGGGYSFRFAGEVPEINAAVVFYGTQPSEALMAKIKAPVLAFFGDDDARVTASMEPTEVALKKLGKEYEAHSYPHATHGFMEYQDVGGNPGAVSDSWPRAITFLKEHTR